MPKIIQLSPAISPDLIAAGEVVERPASAVKELVGKRGGRGRVQSHRGDSGRRHDLPRASRTTAAACPRRTPGRPFCATPRSKLRCAEDLAAIGTMGFRGEALAAIASVSRIDLLTKTAGSMSGTSLKLEAGKVLRRNRDRLSRSGTTIIVRDLFFNTPARMKFMKSDAVEGRRRDRRRAACRRWPTRR